MPVKTCHLYIDNEPYEFEVDGDFSWGRNELLFEKRDNIISKMPWKEKGYDVVEALTNDEFSLLKKSIEKIIMNSIRRVGLNFAEDTFILENYHHVVNTNELHYKIIDITRNLQIHDFDFDIDALVDRFSQILGYKLTSWVEELQKSHIQIRISRPNSLDINPPHRDGYLSYWKDIVNVWIPITGCNSKSSLPVYSGSHLIPENEILRTESKGAKINGNVYYVPCILETNRGAIHMTRPDPKQGEALIFSPYLIHGAAVNRNDDITRISLELRFPRVKA